MRGRQFLQRSKRLCHILQFVQGPELVQGQGVDYDHFDRMHAEGWSDRQIGLLIMTRANSLKTDACD
jgi:hypothetical protein